MSVKASDRKPSKMQFEVLSNEIRDDVSRVLMNKRLVEPKWKYIIAVPGCDCLCTRKLAQNGES